MLKVTTWNVNGIRAREAQVAEWIEREKPDVLCIQEVKASREQVPASLCELPGYWCYWHGHKGYSGVGLHLARAAFPSAPRYAHPAFDHETRIVTATVGNLMFASIYVPNGGKDFPAKVRFIDAMDLWVAETIASGTELVASGDINVAREPRDVHVKLRKPTQIGQTPEEQAQLERVIGRGVVDMSRKFHPDDDELFTWWAPWRNLRERNHGWRIDYIFATPSLADRAVSCEVSPKFGTSDHAPVTAVFDIVPPSVSPSGDEEPALPPEKTGQLGLF